MNPMIKSPDSYGTIETEIESRFLINSQIQQSTLCYPLIEQLLYNNKQNNRLIE